MSGELGGKERRRSERIATHRAVVFSDYRAVGPLRMGTVVDMSAGGFRILTSFPEQSGTHLQIELQPSADDPGVDVALFQGRIVHVSRTEKGDYSLGIRTLQPSRSGLLGIPTKSVTADNTPRAVWPAVSETAASESTEPGRKVTYRRIVPKEKKPWGKWLAGLLLVAALALFILNAARSEQRRQAAPGPGKRVIVHADIVPQLVEETAALDGDAPMVAAEALVGDLASVMPLEWRGAVDSAALLASAQAALEAGRFDEAEQLFKRMQAAGAANPTERFISTLGHAQTAAASGERGLALTMARSALAHDEGVSEAWLDQGRAFVKRLKQWDASPGMDAMEEVLQLADAQPVETGTGSQPPLRIEVDTSDYELRVFRDGRPVARFTVGLGRNGATPIGSFTIANKISDPDWYNRGIVVPAGSPDNPLGKSWMGLGAGGVPTSYGLHPTRESESIGRARSRGCVRLRPADAEALFRLAPIGTPVEIHY